jgi:hypothetical protein
MTETERECERLIAALRQIGALCDFRPVATPMRWLAHQAAAYESPGGILAELETGAPRRSRPRSCAACCATADRFSCVSTQLNGRWLTKAFVTPNQFLGVEEPEDEEELTVALADQPGGIRATVRQVQTDAGLPDFI